MCTALLVTHLSRRRYEGRKRGSYNALSSKAGLTVRLYDRKSGRRRTLLGQAAFSADSIKVRPPLPAAPAKGIQHVQFDERR